MQGIPENPMTIEIRPARIQDAARMAELLHQLGYERTPAEVIRYIQASERAPGINTLVAVVPEGGIVGCLQVVVDRRLAEGDRGEIASLVVADTWRSQGVGARLTQAAIEWLQARSIERVRVRCNIKRERAHRFYERFGFRTSKAQKVFDLSIDTDSPFSDLS